MSIDSSRELFDELKRRGIDGIRSLPTSEFREDPRLDFKESAENTGQGHRPNLAVFAKAASAFANTSGGVIVWGVEAKTDKPIKLKPIPEVRQFCDRLMDMKGRILDPPMSGVESHVIEDIEGEGYVLTFIPSSERKPHAALGKDQKTFYMRAGSNSLPMPTEFVRALMMSNAVPVLRAHSEFTFAHTNASFLDEDERVDVPVYECRLSLSLMNEGEALAEQIAVALPHDTRTRKHTLIGGSVFEIKQYGPTNDGLPASLRLCRWSEERILYPHMSLELGGISEVFRDADRLNGGFRYICSLFSRSTSYIQVAEIPGSFLRAKFDTWLKENPRRRRPEGNWELKSFEEFEGL